MTKIARMPDIQNKSVFAKQNGTEALEKINHENVEVAGYVQRLVVPTFDKLPGIEFLKSTINGSQAKLKIEMR